MLVGFFKWPIFQHQGCSHARLTRDAFAYPCERMSGMKGTTWVHPDHCCVTLDYLLDLSVPLFLISYNRNHSSGLIGYYVS